MPCISLGIIIFDAESRMRQSFITHLMRVDNPTLNYFRSLISQRVLRSYTRLLLIISFLHKGYFALHI